MSARNLQLNYLIESRWIEAYGVRVDPEAVLATFSGSTLPDDVRLFFENRLATDPRDFFSPGGVRQTSSDGRTYTLRLGTDDAWNQDQRPRTGAPTAKFKGLHDVQTQTSSGESGISGKGRQPGVGVHANLLGPDVIPAASVGGRLTGYGGSSIQQQSGDTNRTQQLSSEMTGEGQTYTNDLAVTWLVEDGPEPVASTPRSDSGTGRETSGNPPSATTATEGVDGIELVNLPNPGPVGRPAEGNDGTVQAVSGNPALATTPPTAPEGTTGTAAPTGTTAPTAPTAPRRRVLEPAPIPQGVRLILMGGLRSQERYDLPPRISFADPWPRPTAPTTGGTATNNTGTTNAGTENPGTGPRTGTVDTGTRTNTTGTGTAANNTGTNTRNRRNGGYLANSHPIAVQSLIRRPAAGSPSPRPSQNNTPQPNTTPTTETQTPRPPQNNAPQPNTTPTSLNDWIADRLGYESADTPPKTRKVLHRTHGNRETPAVVTRRKTGSREQHRELNRFGVLSVFSDDVVMTQLPTMTSEPRTISVPDAKGESRTITMQSLPESMERVPHVPDNFNLKLTDRLTRGAGLVANRFKGFSAAFSAGLISRLPGDMIRLEVPAFQERFQKVWARGRGRSDNAWDAHLFHSTDTAVYRTRRVLAVWMDGDTTPTLFDLDTIEAITADDVRRLDEGRPETNAIDRTGDPFLDRGLGSGNGPTHLGDALVREVTYPDGAETRVPGGAPARPFFRDYAHRVLTEIDREYPGLVLPHLAIPGTPEPRTSHAGWRHRRNKSQAQKNTEIFLDKVNAASFRADPDAWLSGQMEVKLVETKKFPWLNEFRERRLFVPDHISVWPRVKIDNYSEAAPLDNSHTGTTTGSSSSLNRNAGKFTSLTNEARVGVNVRSVNQGLDSFGHPSQSGGPTFRMASDFRDAKRSEHGIFSATETNVKDKSGSRRLFANAEFTAWIGPKDGLVPRSSRAEAVTDMGMGREIFGARNTAPRARLELHAPRVGARVPLDNQPTEDVTRPRTLPPANAYNLFRQGPAGFVNTDQVSTRVFRSTPNGLETVPEEAEPTGTTPRTESRNPQRTTGENTAPPTTEGTARTTTRPGTENTTGTTTERREGDGRRGEDDDSTASTTQRDDDAPEPLAIQRTPRSESLMNTFGTVQAFNPALFQRDGNVITVGSLTYEALTRDDWSFSRSVDSRDGSTAIIATHVSSQTLAASPDILSGTGDRFRTQLDDGLALQRTRPTTVTWYVPTQVTSATLRDFATLEVNQVREISFGSGHSHENMTTLSITTRGVFNFQGTAETPDQAQRGADRPMLQPGLEMRYTPHGHSEGESSSVSYRNRREVKFTGASFEFITGGVILQTTEHKQDFDFIVTFPRSPGENQHTGWYMPVRDAQKVMVPALWVFAQGLVHDAITWRDDGTFQFGTQPPPTAPPTALTTKPDLLGKGVDSRPLQVDSMLADLNRQLRADGWELTVNSREDVIKALNRHVDGNRTGLEVRVKRIGPRVRNHSRTATLDFDVHRAPSNVDHLGGLIEYVDRNIETSGNTQTNIKIRGHGTGGAFGLLAPIGNEHDPATGRDTGAISAGGTPGFRQQSRTEQTDSQGTARELTQERVLFSPYAVVTTPTDVTMTLSFGDREYTVQSENARQESIYPLPYLEAGTTGQAGSTGPRYVPIRERFEVDAWSRTHRGRYGTGFQDGDGGLDAVPVAIQGEAKLLLDAAVVNAALLDGWTKPNERADTEAGNVASATRYLDGKITDIERANGITARKDELLLQAKTPDATHEPTVLAEFKESVVKVRTLIDTGSARIEGVSNESRARDSDQEGGRQSQGTVEQTAKNAGLSGQVTESGRPSDRIRETLESESAGLRGARGGNSSSQRHGAVADGPGTKRMFLVRVPAVWAIWAESKNGTNTRGGHADASILRWVDADQARDWGLRTESPEIEGYATAEKRFTDADAAYFKARGELFSHVGRAHEAGAVDDGYQARYEELLDAVHRTEDQRTTAMQNLVDALHALRASQPAPVTRTTPPTGTTNTETPRNTPTLASGPAVENTETRTTTDNAPTNTAIPRDNDHRIPNDPTTNHQQTTRIEPTLPPDDDLYDADPRPTPPTPTQQTNPARNTPTTEPTSTPAPAPAPAPAPREPSPNDDLDNSAPPTTSAPGRDDPLTRETPVSAPAPRATSVNDDVDDGAPVRGTDPARNTPTPEASGEQAREPATHEAATPPAPTHDLGQRDSNGILRFPGHADLAAYQNHLHDRDFNPNAYDTHKPRTQRYIQNFTADGWIAEFSRLRPLNEETVQAELDRHRQASRAHPGWQLYEVGLGRWPDLRTLRAHLESGRLTPEQESVVRDVLDSPDPEMAMDQLRGRAGSAGRIAEANLDRRKTPTFPDAQDVLDIIERLDQVTRHPLPEGVEAVRGVYGFEHLRPDANDDPNVLIGSVHTEHGFMPVSLGNRPGAIGGQPTDVIYFDLPEGTEGMWVGEHSLYPTEREIILARGTTYRIISVERWGLRGYALYARVIPPQHAPASAPTVTETETESAPVDDPVGAPPESATTTTAPDATAEEPETTGEDRPSRQDELNAEFHGALNVPPNG